MLGSNTHIVTKVHLLPKRVWEVCQLSSDLQSGRLDPSKFAVEFFSVLQGKADDLYKDSEQFFSKTFLSNNMRYIIIQILKRLYSGDGKPVLVLSTEFGGGKTHTLLLVYHLLKDKIKGFEYLKRYEIEKELGIIGLPDVHVISIDCRRLGSEITLWGEIGRQLGMYDKVKKYDQEKIPPSVDVLTDLLEKPVLLLVDEFYDYVFDASGKNVGNKTLGELTINFVLNLMAVVSNTKRSLLLLTLTGEQAIYQQEAKEFMKAADESLKSRLMGTVREAITRQSQFIPPIERVDIYDVVRTRLIQSDSINEGDRDYAVSWFSDYYSRIFFSF